MIELSKKYETRDGRTVRIYAIDGVGQYPIHGAIKYQDGWNHTQWMTDGRILCFSGIHQNDLIEVKPEITGWVNFYKDHKDAFKPFFTMYTTKEAADDNAVKGRIACIEVTFKEGDGL